MSPQACPALSPNSAKKPQDPRSSGTVTCKDFKVTNVSAQMGQPEPQAPWYPSILGLTTFPELFSCLLLADYLDHWKVLLDTRNLFPRGIRSQGGAPGCRRWDCVRLCVGVHSRKSCQASTSPPRTGFLASKGFRRLGDCLGFSRQENERRVRMGDFNFIASKEKHSLQRFYSKCQGKQRLENELIRTQ